jgi:hypothetical protein
VCPPEEPNLSVFETEAVTAMWTRVCDGKVGKAGCIKYF